MASLPLILCLVGQAPPPGGGKADDPAARLEFIKKSVESYAIQANDDRATPFRLVPEPVMKFENPISGITDGAVYFWTGDADRPEATLQLFQLRDGGWWHEFTSLSTGRLVVRARSGPDWAPTRPGVEFRPIDDAPRPADSAEQRLRQMCALAQDFTVDDHFQGKTWHPLRLLTKPLARYGKPGASPTDGALFSFALGTNPEAFLLIEARPGPAAPQWQYAFAPMTAYELKASWKGKQVWTLPWQKSSRNTDPFYSHRYLPGP